MNILVLNGPNLNLLGQREPDVYGTLTLDELNRQLAQFGEELNERRAGVRERVELFFYQSNHEGVLVDTIQDAPRNYQGIVYNPAAHTHYSIALRDAIASITIPVVEVHLSDISLREGFRSHSVIVDACIGQFKGRGAISYRDGVEFIVERIDALALSPASLGISDGVGGLDELAAGSSNYRSALEQLNG
ncbi:MAG: 3-dehydroquinate dehydratase [Coriobacteriales bacterium]|jgi:3-dehydroquinate dehydratase-2|nr:3-dehydroquinate dehydratase [Coriobacteriales bacterium]